MALVPDSLPPLPENPNGWPANVHAAYELLEGAFAHAVLLLHQEDGEPLRLNLVSEKLVNEMVPILEQLELEGVNQEFTHACAHAIGPLVCELKVAAMAAEGVERNNIVFLEPVEIVRTGKPGRPRKNINVGLMQEAFAPNRNIKAQQFANTIGVERTLLRKQMKAAGIKSRKEFDAISDADLDARVRQYKTAKPTSGRRYIVGLLRNEGIRIQKDRVRESLKRVDGLGVLLRTNTIQRRTYSVPRPNYLWHCDGHHKLIWWGIVIHGFIDGYCRTITGLLASTNNRAETVLEVFKAAIAKHGQPSRLRGDRGGENVQVSVWMIMHCGPNRASFMWGSSTHNTRIERLWVEVGVQFARQWRAFFTRLGGLHHLDRKNPGHIWLLHQLFLDNINDDCNDFQAQWNAHPISGRGANDQSPADMRFMGQLDAGVYASDPMENVHPETINRYYGVEGPELDRRRGQTGAGHPDDEEDEWMDEEEEFLTNAVTEDLAHNIRHPPVKVARHHNPFRTAAREANFIAALAEIIQQDIVPEGYGVLEHEWEDCNYPEREAINPGTRGKEIIVALPREIWLPRAILFARALDAMTRFLVFQEAEGDGGGSGYASPSSSQEDID